VTPYYDPTIAKLIANENDRWIEAPDAITIEGVKHNIPFVWNVFNSKEFRAGHVHTGLGAEILARTVKKSTQPIKLGHPAGAQLLGLSKWHVLTS